MITFLQLQEPVQVLIISLLINVLSRVLLYLIHRVLSANDSVLRALLEAEKAADDQN